jgi:multiple sugar transport system substrate-binding protein
MNRTSRLAALALICSSIAIAGCSGSGEEAPDAQGVSATPAAKSSNEPINLTVYQRFANITDAEFEQFFVQPIKRKYPHITLSLVRNGKGTAIEELLASGSVPDLFFLDNDITTFKKLDIAYDLTDAVKTSKLDLSKFDAAAIDAIKKYSGEGKLLALPFSLNWFGLFYNKDIFDKFNAPYPKDKMTWEDITELARRTTRYEANVQVFGLDPRTPSYVAGGLSLPIVDPATNKALVNTDAWKRVLQMMKGIYDIPGNTPDKSVYGTAPLFFQNRVIGMYAYWGIGVVNQLEELQKKGNPMNWDMVTTPNFKEALGTGQAVNIHNLMISRASKHKEQAFQIVQELLSEEVQTLAVRSARMSSLTKLQAQTIFGENLQTMQGKNKSGVVAVKSAKLPNPTEYDSRVQGIVNTKFTDVLYAGKDINTALREAEEDANKMIKADLDAKSK